MEECTVISSTKVSKRSNHQWSPHEDIILIDGCLEFINQGWKAENGFKTGFYQQLQKWMSAKIPGCHITGDPHIKNRLRHLKMQYKEFSMMRDASGFGWNEERKMVTCDDEVWTSWIKSHKDATHLRYKSFPYFDELAMIFGNEWASGDKCESPAEMVTALGKGSDALTGGSMSKKAVQDDFFGVAVDLESMNDHIFSTPDINKNKKRATSVPIKEEFSGSKKSKKSGSFDKHAEDFQQKMERIMELCATSNKQFEKMSTFFDRFNAADDSKPHILDMIMNIPNLSKENAIRAFGIISASKGKTDSFLLMPDEEAKLIYINATLNGEI
ncbi:unnamed protein product [Cuscuta epithymum]|uniref:Myb/SANT-like domain-containing protein n=1 Tax=Cuscuta epithymum TaxID=186058 RepID=A0AAV0CBM7_9ASTE|nr:unnamed protein product [Cuscuta epithymum]